MTSALPADLFGINQNSSSRLPTSPMQSKRWGMSLDCSHGISIVDSLATRRTFKEFQCRNIIFLTPVLPAPLASNFPDFLAAT